MPIGNFSDMPPERQKTLVELHSRFVRFLRAEAADYDPVDVLAVLAYSTGAAAAMQDARRLTAENVSDIISENIQQGNRAAIDLFGPAPDGPPEQT